MKRTITILLLVAGTMAAQGPGNWGPGGIPTDWRGSGIEWMESAKFTSSAATSYQYFSSSADADSLVWVQTQAAGDNDMVFKFVEDDGTVHSLLWNDGDSKFYTTENFYINELITNNLLQVGNSTSIYTRMYTGGKLDTRGQDLLIDPGNLDARTLTLGETGDHDITFINSRLTTTITTVDTTTVMGAADGWMYTMTAADTLKCPVTPLAGEVLECKFTNASGGMLFGNGKNIDGASEVAASENENIRIVYNATSGEWERR